MKNKWFKTAVALICSVSVVFSTFVMQFVAADSGTVNDVPLANPYAIHTYGSTEALTGLWAGMQLFNHDDKNDIVDATKAQ